jgi:uncharacterized protein (TIGR02145 family)
MTKESISIKLSELFDLFKSGALTNEEYDRLKRQVLSEGGVENAEPEKKQEQETVKTPDKPIQEKKGSKIWILAITVIVLLAVVFLLFKNTLFSSKSESTGQNAQTLKDIDGNVYKTVNIGTQVWMAENLKTTKYNDGSAIPLVTDNTAWEALNTPAYCWYDNNETANKNTCGALYNWYTVNTNKLCPTGWHVPTREELTTLITYLGGESAAGGKLKEVGITHWKSPNAGATNETGFTALPGGYLHHAGTFFSIGSDGFWWLATEYDDTHAWNSSMHYNIINMKRQNFLKQNGFSVRCLRDLSTSKNNVLVSDNPVVENKTAVWNNAAATKIIMDELSKYDWTKIEKDKSYEWNHEIVGFTKISLSNKELMVALVNDKYKFGRDLSIFEFEDRDGWKLRKKSIAFCQGEIVPLSNLSNQKNLFTIAPDNYGVLIKSDWGEKNAFIIEKDLYAFINSEFKVIFSINHSFGKIERNPDFELNFITGTDGYYKILTLDKDDSYSDTKFRYKFNGVEYVKE